MSSPALPVTDAAEPAATAPEKSHLRLGFVALSDAAPLIAAKILEFGHRHGLTLELSCQPSWAAIRDKLLAGELDAAHTLYGLAYGVQLGIGGPQCDMAVLMVLSRNGQAITLSERLSEAYEASQNLPAALRTLHRRPVFAQTFPTGTHAMLMNYWLAAQGVHPFNDIQNVVIPPPQMADALERGTLDGFCAGEPWNAVAEAKGVGRTAMLTSDIWPNHPEKVLASRRDFVTNFPHTARALIRTLLEASRWLDAPKQREAFSHWLSQPEYVGVAQEILLPRLLGHYPHRRLSNPPLAVSFFAGGRVNYPAPRDGLWFISQFRRWGMLDAAHPAWQDAAAFALASEVSQTELYRQAAVKADVLIAEPQGRETFFDGRHWDGDEIAQYLNTLSTQQDR